MSVAPKTRVDSLTPHRWLHLINRFCKTLRDLASFDFSSFSPNRDEHIDRELAANQLLRKTATSIGNNCLLDTIFQQVYTCIREPNFEDFVHFVRERIDQTQGEQLSINDEEQGVQILSAAQAYLFATTGLQYHFDLTVLLADNEGNIGYVDMQPMMRALSSYGEAIPIRMIVVNYNHYEPIFEKEKQESISYETPYHDPSTQEREEQMRLQGMKNSSSSSVSIDPLPEEGGQELRPLRENPLVGFTRLGFGLSHMNSLNFHQKYRAWFEVLDRGHLSPRRGAGYLSNLQRFKDTLGIPEIEEGAGRNSEHLIKIEQAARMILYELSKEDPDLGKLQPYIDTIRDHAYELIIDPEKEVLAYIQSPLKIFIDNQTEFQEELEKITQKNPLKETLSQRIVEAACQGKVLEEKEKLVKEYPDEGEIIGRLAEAIEQLFLKVIEIALKKIGEYQKRREVAICYEWFLRFPHLLDKYQALQRGQYFSIADIPRESFFSGQIYYPSYVPSLSSLIVACQNLQKGDRSKASFEEYLLLQRKYRHFQETLVPLSFFLEVIDNMLFWPAVYEPSEGEWEFLSQSIMFFMGIANKNFPGNIRIPYEYLSISEDKIKSETALLRKKNVTTARKRIACRYLYHANIPWKSLRTIGNLTHRSGGVSDQEAAAKDQLLRTAIVGFIGDLSQVKEAVSALIDFELREFDSEPFIVEPDQFSPLFYPGINLLGNFEESRVHVRESLEILNHWYNRALKPSDFSEPKIQYAILRTIQFQGEVTKNIREFGVLGVDPIWQLFEEIRDLLSHSERIQTERRLEELLENPQNRSFSMGIVEDIRNIREFLQRRFDLLNSCKTWDERLRYLNSGAQLRTYLDLPGLESFFIFLTNKISTEVQDNLLRSLRSEQSIRRRAEISSIVRRFLHQEFDSTNYKDSVKLLPLTTTQKKEVENGIKLVISSKAARNDAKDAKHSMLKTSISVIDSLLQNKRGNYPRDELTALKGMLEDIKESIEEEAFEGKVNEARGFFQRLKENPSLPQERLSVIEENLANLTEDVEGYLTRKKELLFSILNAIPIDLSDSDIEARAIQIIQDMQLGKISPGSLEISLYQLGINEEEKERWIQANQCCLGTKNIVSAEESERSEILELKQMEQSIEKIQNRIRRLDRLMMDQDAGSIMKDPLFLLACQYLISDFRSAASNLELNLESIKYAFVPLQNLEFIQEIQRNLLFFMKRGNDILHAHDISEPGTMTPYGIKFLTQQDVARLIYDFITEGNTLFHSLLSQLEELKLFLPAWKPR